MMLITEDDLLRMTKDELMAQITKQKELLDRMIGTYYRNALREDIERMQRRVNLLIG